MSISGAAAAAGGDLPVDSARVLAEFATSRQRAEAEALRQVELALAFCSFNSADSCSGSRRPGARVPGSEGELSLAGEGAPGVAEFAAVEFAAVAGMSTTAGLAYLGKCLELGHRLPQVWQATRTGQVPAWRALRIAEHTQPLPAPAAAWVDDQIAPRAGRVGMVVLERLITEALTRFDPDTAELARLDALETRHATITLHHAPTEQGAAAIGTVLATGRLEAVLEAADAVDLDAALAAWATALRDAGNTDPLRVRRSTALGMLARGEPLPNPHPNPNVNGSDPDGSDPDGSHEGPDTPAGAGRGVVLHVHYRADDPHGIADLHTPTGTPLGQVTIEQVQEWCGNPTAHVTVKPVLDLTEALTCSGYTPSARLREQTIALHRVCVFPWCHRPAPACDLDHLHPYHDGGATCTTNLAPLCRRHHRAKTHCESGTEHLRRVPNRSGAVQSGAGVCG